MHITRIVVLRLFLFAAGYFPLIVGCQFASGQSLDAIDKCDEAVREAWAKTPFVLRNALFVTGSPEAFGSYTPRSPAPFKSGEQMIVYVEPVAFEWKSLEDGQCEFGFTVDLLVKTAAGQTILEKNKFGTMMFKSRAQNREVFLKLTVNLTGATPGDYLLDFRVHDAEAADAVATFELPITLE
jgi:hypothetical protein